MSKEHEAIKADLKEIQDSIKQMLVLSWINANAKRRNALLNELEAVAAKNDIKLIKEVVATIAQIAQDEQAKELASKSYYFKHCIFPITGCQDYETGFRE